MLSSQARAVPVRMAQRAAMLPGGAGAWHGARPPRPGAATPLAPSLPLGNSARRLHSSVPTTTLPHPCVCGALHAQDTPNQPHLKLFLPHAARNKIRLFPALLQVGHPSVCPARMRIRHQLLPESCSGHRKSQSLLTPQRVQPCLLGARVIWRLLCNERMMNVSISRTRKAREISGG